MTIHLGGVIGGLGIASLHLVRVMRGLGIVTMRLGRVIGRRDSVMRASAA